MKPLIAITVESRHDPENARTQGKLELNWNYFDEIARAGGNPIVITPGTDVGELAPLLDGWLIPGGLDIAGGRFGQEDHAAAKLQHPSRFETESRLLAALAPEAPVLGICYGCQFLNVAEGGDLIQHLPDSTETSHEHGILQAYPVSSGSLLARAAGATALEGESWHHQAVGRVAEGWTVTSRADDGTIEAIEHPGHPFRIGVQWHPERTAPSDPNMRNLFSSFVRAAAEFRATKSAPRK